MGLKQHSDTLFSLWTLCLSYMSERWREAAFLRLYRRVRCSPSGPFRAPSHCSSPSSCLVLYIPVPLSASLCYIFVLLSNCDVKQSLFLLPSLYRFSFASVFSHSRRLPLSLCLCLSLFTPCQHSRLPPPNLSYLLFSMKWNLVDVGLCVCVWLCNLVCF